MKRREDKPAVHMIGNAHLDPVWLWRWQEGFAEIRATFRSALDRMAEYPDFIFTCAGAAYYRWIEENSPDMFREIIKRVEEGRWVIVGGWWIQPDCNMPCGESFVRHGLYSQRYFLEKFGLMASTGYNVDSFGHSGMLPQILSKSGMARYVFMRPGKHEKDLPGDLFFWESKDGSRVLASRIAHYSATDWISKNVLETTILSELEEAGKGNTGLMSFYGVGNHGGGPTIANIECILKLQRTCAEGQVIFSSPDRFFSEIENRDVDLPIVREDLQHHASGCYAAHSEIKVLNRRAEQRLIGAEKLAALAHLLLGMDYPAKRLQAAWEKVLFNQFHDILGGCSIQAAYDDARESFGWSLSTSAEILDAAAQKISWEIDTRGGSRPNPGKVRDWILWEADDEGVPLVVFNPLSWAADIPVQVNIAVRGVEDDRGMPLEIEQVRGPYTNGVQKWNTLFIGRVPALGYRVFRIFGRRECIPPENGTPLSDGRDFLENDRVRLEIDPENGTISRFFDKQNGVDVFSGQSAVPLVIDETSCDTWAHGVFTFDHEIGRFGHAETRLVENGPLRATIRVKSHFHESVLQQDFSIYKDRSDVEVRVRIDWREHHRMLKLAFPVNVDQPVATYEIPYGFIEKPVNGEEEPGQQWLDVSGQIVVDRGGSEGTKEIRYGLALLNDGKYSFSVQDGEMRMTAVRSPAFADHFGERDEELEFMDQGIQTFRYVLAPHEGTWQTAAIARKACELNMPVIHVVGTNHEGSLPCILEGIRTGAANIFAPVLKISEDGRGYILRCHETSGENTRTALEMPLAGRQWTADFCACEIKTFLIPFEPDKPVQEVNLVEMA